MAAHWKQRETLFAEYGLRLILPGAWQLRPLDVPRRWIYRSADHREHLTITMGDAESVRTDRERDASLRHALAKNRRAVELGFARMPEFEMSEVEVGVRADVLAGWYQGGAGQAHRLMVLVLWTNDAVWSFVYEGFRLPEGQAEVRSAAIFDSATLR